MSEDEKAIARVQELEKEKDRLIHKYIRMQDQADDLNGQIYHVCCDIEILNRRIEQAREEARKLAQRVALKGANGGSNGNGHNP